jgi:hypothetical protein
MLGAIAIIIDRLLRQSCEAFYRPNSTIKRTGEDLNRKALDRCTVDVRRLCIARLSVLAFLPSADLSV